MQMVSVYKAFVQLYIDKSIVSGSLSKKDSSIAIARVKGSNLLKTVGK